MVLLRPLELSAVGGEAGTKRSEPEAFALGISRQGVLQRGENAWAADVAVSTQDFTGGVQLVRSQCRFLNFSRRIVKKGSCSVWRSGRPAFRLAMRLMRWR